MENPPYLCYVEIDRCLPIFFSIIIKVLAMIRSVSIATNTPYCEVHKIMYSHGWRASKNKSDSNWENQITKTLTQLGFTYCKLSYPATKGLQRMKATTMPNEGTYILRQSKHVVAYKDGILMDTWDCSQKCVYFAWRITPL